VVPNLVRAVQRLKRKLDATEQALAVATMRLREQQLETENAVDSLSLLEQSLQRRALLYDHAPIGLLTVDRRGVIREANQQVCMLAGIDRRMALGMPLARFVGSADRARLTRHIGACYRDGRAATGLHLRKPDGALLAVDLLTERSPGADHLLVAVVDQRIRVRIAAAQAGALDLESPLRRDGRLDDHVLALVSHEMRAPLAPLLAVAQALEDRSAGSPELAQIAAVVRQNVLAEARLIEDLLDVSRLERGKLSLKRKPSDVHEAARDALGMLTGEIAAKAFKVSVEFDAEPSLVDGDLGRLRQVFWNLLRNAIQFTPAGGSISLRSWNRPSSVLVEVADSGIGLSERALSRLFAPFEQVNSRAGRSQGGLGLGLAICQGIISQHNGEIIATSPGRGRGARFVVDLPATAVRSLAASVTKELAHADEVRPQPAKVLVIEDNQDLARAMADGLRHRGYVVRVAATAQAALREDVAGVDVVVSDLRLPDGSGHELVRCLRQRSAMKAIALSGSDTERDVETSAELGFFAHLTKPIEIESLAATIERALGHS
jgi:PAS domain S-box-containing protein